MTRKRILMMFLAILATAIVYGVTNHSQDFDYIPNIFPTQSTVPSSVSLVTELKNVPKNLQKSGRTRYHFQRLSDLEQSAYARFLQELPQFPESLNARDLSNEELERVFMAMMLDQPLLFFVSNSHYRTTKTQRGDLVEFKPEYTMTPEEYERSCQELAEVVPLVEGSDFERELFLHDFLVKKCQYKSDKKVSRNTAYGALIQGLAACEGYSRAMLLMLECNNFAAYIVTGDAGLDGSREGHAWNKVWVNGAWYHLDATWDDPITTEKNFTLSHAYFNLSDEELRPSHEITNRTNPCVSTGENYFQKKGLLFSSLEQKDAHLVDVLIQIMEEKTDAFELRFTNPDTLNAGKKYLLDDQTIFRILEQANVDGSIRTGTIRHSITEDLNILRFIPRLP